jgi:hypothetical protein
MAAGILVTSLAVRPPYRMSLCGKRNPQVRNARLPL